MPKVRRPGQSPAPSSDPAAPASAGGDRRHRVHEPELQGAHIGTATCSRPTSEICVPWTRRAATSRRSSASSGSRPATGGGLGLPHLPISLRFVRPPAPPLDDGGPRHHDDRAHPGHPHRGRLRVALRHEEALYEHRRPPHSAQVNTLTGSHDLVPRFPRYDEWQEVHARLNASGVFDSPFSSGPG